MHIKLGFNVYAFHLHFSWSSTLNESSNSFPLFCKNANGNFPDATRVSKFYQKLHFYCLRVSSISTYIEGGGRDRELTWLFLWLFCTSNRVRSCLMLLSASAVYLSLGRPPLFSPAGCIMLLLLLLLVIFSTHITKCSNHSLALTHTHTRMTPTPTRTRAHTLVHFRSRSLTNAHWDSSNLIWFK